MEYTPEEKYMVARLPNALRIELEIVHANLLSEIYYHRVYDRHHIYQGEDIVVDVGAHMGVFSLRAAMMGAHVYAFEPHPENFRMLLWNVNRNVLSSLVTCYQVALGDEEGIYKLWIDPTLSGSHSLRFKKEEWIAVSVSTLDRFVEREEMKKISLLKVDVEGAEPEVLRGARKSLGITEDVAIAAYHYAEEAREIKTMLEVLGFNASIEAAGPYADTNFVYGKRKGS